MEGSPDLMGWGAMGKCFLLVFRLGGSRALGWAAGITPERPRQRLGFTPPGWRWTIALLLPPGLGIRCPCQRGSQSVPVCCPETQ